jgi:hypothetical protein
MASIWASPPLSVAGAVATWTSRTCSRLAGGTTLAEVGEDHLLVAHDGLRLAVGDLDCTSTCPGTTATGRPGSPSPVAVVAA